MHEATAPPFCQVTQTPQGEWQSSSGDPCLRRRACAPPAHGAADAASQGRALLRHAPHARHQVLGHLGAGEGEGGRAHKGSECRVREQGVGGREHSTGRRAGRRHPGAGRGSASLVASPAGRWLRAPAPPLTSVGSSARQLMKNLEALVSAPLMSSSVVTWGTPRGQGSGVGQGGATRATLRPACSPMRLPRGSNARANAGSAGSRWVAARQQGWRRHPSAPWAQRAPLCGRALISLTMPGDRLCTPTFLTPNSFSSASRLLPSCARERLVAPYAAKRGVALPSAPGAGAGRAGEEAQQRAGASQKGRSRAGPRRGLQRAYAAGGGGALGETTARRG
jgi:hypothetical protein